MSIFSTLHQNRALILTKLIMILLAFFTAKDCRIHPPLIHMTSINVQLNHIQALCFVIERASRGIQIEKSGPN